MADNSQPALKKRKINDAEHSSLATSLYQPPNVYDKQTARETKHRERSTIPRALLTAQSAYFEKAFTEGFKEAATGTLELKNVRPWVFRTFVGWLYYHAIYHDPERIEPTRFAANDQSSHDLVLTETASASGVTAGEQDIASSGIPQGPRPVWPHQSTTPPEALDEDDHRNPVTWPFDHLFELYVFADQYDTRDLRMATLEVIQMKFLQHTPRSYQFPCPSAAS